MKFPMSKSILRLRPLPNPGAIVHHSSEPDMTYLTGDKSFVPRACGVGVCFGKKCGCGCIEWLFDDHNRLHKCLNCGVVEEYPAEKPGTKYVQLVPVPNLPEKVTATTSKDVLRK